MTTPYEIANCRLYLGDALEILPTLPKSDLIVCDPPYKLTHGGAHGSLGGCLSTENYDNKGGIVDCDIDWPDFMPLFFESLKKGCHAYIMANNRHVQNMLASADSTGFEFHNLLVWDKISATPNRWYMKNCEFIGFFYKPPAKFINDCGAKQLISCPQVDVSGQFDPDGRPHATEKPVSLMQHYIEQSSKVGDTVLDPFMGSGTTGVAAARSGRKFIGIEKNEKFFNMAVRRIKDEIDNHQEMLL